MKSVPAFSIRNKLAIFAIVTAIVLPVKQTQAATVVDTWSAAGGAWTTAKNDLAADGIGVATWTNPTAWTDADRTPHSFSFSADAGSTGSSTLSVAGQTGEPSFSQSAYYYHTGTGASTPTFTVADASALSGVNTISLTLIARYLGGGLPAAENVFQTTSAPLLYLDGGETGLATASQQIGVSSIQRPASSSFYNYITYTWDVASLEVGSFSIDWGSTNQNQLSSISLTQSTTAVPEPSAFAALAGLATLGFAALRRRRRA